MAPLTGNGHSLAKSGNKAREQKQPSPEGVRQQGLRALGLVENELYEWFFQTRVS